MNWLRGTKAITPKRLPAVHDYAGENRYWGHDYTITEVINEGQKLRLMGWGDGLENGDYIILSNDDGSTRYQIDEVKYFSDPSDMWNARVSFAPR